MSRFLAALGLPRLWTEDEEAVWAFLRAYVGPLVMAVAPVCAYGVERVPREGGLVIAANHFSGIDHPALAVASPRPVCFLSKAELFERPLVGDALTWTGAFPVRRGEADRAAIQRAVELAASGRVVAVHLEGTRQSSGRPGVFKPGAVAIARRARVPIVPCGLDTSGWTAANRRPCTVVLGEPISLGDLPAGHRGRAAGLELVGQEVVRLWREAVAAREAGFPPELADGSRRSGACIRGLSRRTGSARSQTKVGPDVL